MKPDTSRSVLLKRRCAVYTRKSSEEGLDQAFNSLHAQREACEAYILSQKSEGWLLLSDRYDDGGHSGGTLERPALQHLIRDIEAGGVDVVVVYKIDRLSRSLMDFSRLVEVLERHNVTFVSVTQHFSTSTSMGRLTLNMLLSFAQFEREIAGERIRDKIAASRKKGIWMGGKLYRYYVTTDVIKRGPDACPIKRLPAAEVESAVVDQIRNLLRAPELVVRTWQQAKIQGAALTERQVREALHRFDPLWNELFPAEQARLVQLLVERLDVGMEQLTLRLRVEGLTSLVNDLRAKRPEGARRAA